MDARPSSAAPRRIALLNQKGGVGKTTTTVNLGAALARRGRRVHWGDLDPQAHLSLHVGVEPDALEMSVYDLLIEEELSAESVIQSVGERMDVLPAQVNLAGAEAELAPLVALGAAQTVLRRKLEPVVERYDYLLIDCPPSLGLLTINALAAAEEVIVPMQSHFLALQGLSKLLETVRLVSRSVNPALRVSGVVLCMHEANTVLAGEVVADLTTFFDAARSLDVPWRGAVIYPPPIRRNIKLAESPSFGQSIFEYAADCHGAADYAQLAESVDGPPAPVEAAPLSVESQT